MHPASALVRDSHSCLVAQPHISLKKRKRTLEYLDIRVLVHFAFAPSPSIHCASSSEDISLRAGCSTTLYLFQMYYRSSQPSNFHQLSSPISPCSSSFGCPAMLTFLSSSPLPSPFLSPPSPLSALSSPSPPYLHAYPVLDVIFSIIFQ